MPGKIIAAGHICLDITPLFPPDRAGKPQEYLVPGSLIRMDGVDIHTGGSVANTGLALHFFGEDVSLMGKVGDDAFGKLVGDILSGHGCDMDAMVVAPGEVTSYSVVLAVPGSDRIFLHAPGANDSFCYDDLDFTRIARAQHFHFGYPPLMRRVYEKGGEELEKIFRRVKELGLTISLDMAAIDPTSPAAGQDWQAILRRILPYVDYFLPSAEELCFMLDRPRFEEWSTRGGDMAASWDAERDIRPLADRLAELGAGTFVIKCGAKGMYYRTPTAEGFQKSFRPERVCSATGAGDVSIAAFLAARMRGYEIEKCVTLAAAAGAASVTAYDALGGLKSLEELEEMVSRGWETQEV